MERIRNTRKGELAVARTRDEIMEDEKEERKREEGGQSQRKETT